MVLDLCLGCMLVDDTEEVNEWNAKPQNQLVVSDPVMVREMPPRWSLDEECTSCDTRSQPIPPSRRLIMKGRWKMCVCALSSGSWLLELNIHEEMRKIAIASPKRSLEGKFSLENYPRNLEIQRHNSLTQRMKRSLLSLKRLIEKREWKEIER